MVTVKQFKEELIASIQNEKRTFDMSRWAKQNSKPATCATACCMAGHIEAIRPKLAAQLIGDYRHVSYIDHERLAQAIWKIETGHECRLDFLADNHPLELECSFLEYAQGITRNEAIAHIRGSKRWPQLK